MGLAGNARIAVEEQARLFRRLGDATRRAPLAQAGALAPDAALGAVTSVPETEFRRALQERAAEAWEDAASALDDLLADRFTPTALRARCLAQLSALDHQAAMAVDPSEQARLEARRRPLDELAAFLRTTGVD